MTIEPVDSNQEPQAATPVVWMIQQETTTELELTISYKDHENYMNVLQGKLKWRYRRIKKTACVDHVIQ